MDRHTLNDLTSYSCINTQKQCNHIEPLNLVGINPTTNKLFTKEEIINAEKQFKNMCNGKDLELKKCCDAKMYENEEEFLINLIKNSNQLDNNYFKNSDIKKWVRWVLDELKNRIKIKKIYKNNKLVEYKICKNNLEGDGKCPKDFEPISYQDICKINKIEDFKVMDFGQVKTITNLVDDCYHSKCSNEGQLSFINKEDRPYIEDLRIIDAIKKEDVDYIKTILGEIKTYDIQLNVGDDGNTILHNAILYKSTSIIDFILTNKINLEVENAKKNTVLNLACLSGDSTLCYKLINLGADVSTKNVYGDTPLHSSVRSGDLGTVLVVLQNSLGSIFEKNMLGETPLHVAFISPKKNKKIIEQLILNGSDLRTKNNNGHSLMKTLNLQKKTKVNAELKTYMYNVYIEKYGDDYTNLIKEDPDASFITMVDKDTNKEVNIDDYDNLEKIEIKLPSKNISKDNIYNNKLNKEKKNIEGFTNHKEENKQIYKITGLVLLLLLLLIILKYIIKN